MLVARPMFLGIQTIASILPWGLRPPELEIGTLTGPLRSAPKIAQNQQQLGLLVVVLRTNGKYCTVVRQPAASKSLGLVPLNACSIKLERALCNCCLLWDGEEISKEIRKGTY